MKKKTKKKNSKMEKAENVRDEEYGILLIVPVRIYGKAFRALVDSGASRCFVSPEVVQTAQLQWELHDTFLELGNGERILSRGRVTNVPVVIGNHCTRCNLTVTSLLHQVDLVLGVSWLKQVNPLIDWNAGAMYLISNGFPGSFLYGQWLESACKIGTVSIIYSSDQLEALKKPEIQKQINVIRNPCFWEYGSVKSANSWASSAARGNKCTVQLKTNDDDPENQVQCIISVTDDQCNVNQSLPSRQPCINTIQNTRNSNPKKFVHSLSRVQGKPVIKTKSRLESQRELMTARGLKKLIKREKEQVFLAVVRCIGRPKIVNAAIHPESQGLTEKKKRELMKASGPKKEFLSVKEREEEILERVQPEFRGKLREIVDEHRDVFPEKLPRGRPPKREIEHSIETDPEAQPSNRAPYRLGPAEQDELEAQIHDLVAQGFIRPTASPYCAPVLFVPKKMDDGGCALTTVHSINKR